MFSLWELGQPFALFGDGTYRLTNYQLILSLHQEVGRLNGYPQSRKAPIGVRPRPCKSSLPGGALNLAFHPPAQAGC